MNDKNVQTTPEYKPDWISEKTLREWLNKSRVTIWRWKEKYNLHHSKMGDATYYDRNQINEILTANSTYAH